MLEAQNAAEAYLLADQHPADIDLLLTDVIMPHASGEKLAKKLMESRPETNVIFISGYAHGWIDSTDERQRNATFLAKSIRPVELALKVREVLDARSSRG